jgi:hypothetical protein
MPKETGKVKESSRSAERKTTKPTKRAKPAKRAKPPEPVVAPKDLSLKDFKKKFGNKKDETRASGFYLGFHKKKISKPVIPKGSESDVLDGGFSVTKTREYDQMVKDLEAAKGETGWYWMFDKSFLKFGKSESNVTVLDDLIYPASFQSPPRSLPEKTAAEKKIEKETGVKIPGGQPALAAQTIQHQQNFLDFYERGLIPFMAPTAQALSYTPFELVKAIPEAETIKEKPLYPGELSTQGQHLQAKVLDQKWVGLYTQTTKWEPKRDDPFPHLKRAKKVYADNDPGGHFLAWQMREYAPVEGQKFYFGKDGMAGIEGEINMGKVNLFLANSVLNSFALTNIRPTQNVTQELLNYPKERDEAGKLLTVNPFFYLPSSGKPSQLTLSEQIVSICGGIYETNPTLLVSTADGKEVAFELDKSKFPDIPDPDKAVVELVFRQYENEKQRNLMLDDLLRVLASTRGLDPVSAQNMLVSLNKMGWISYPRIKLEEAEETPIRLLKPIDGGTIVVDGKIVKTDGFQGSEQELEALRLIEATEKTEDKNFLRKGEWKILVNGKVIYSADGKEILSKEVIEGVPASDKQHYTSKPGNREMDIKLVENGMTRTQMMEFLISNEIGKPATRSAQLARLAEAGVVIKGKDDLYILDARGIILASAYQVLQEKDGLTVPMQAKMGLIERQMKPETTQESIQKMADVVNEFQFISEADFTKALKEKAILNLEKAEDLSQLDVYH